jgi:hypothetical protein
VGGAEGGRGGGVGEGSRCLFNRVRVEGAGVCGTTGLCSLASSVQL